MRRSLAALLLCLSLTACTSGGAEPTPRSDIDQAAARVDVDTPALRAQKQQAGVAPCRPGAASNDLPAVTLPCLGGGPDVGLASLPGPLVVNLFAQWCGPCRVEMPLFQRLHEQAGDRLSVVGVDYLDTQPAAALDLVRESGVTYPLLADPAGRLRDEFRIRGLPAIVLVDEEGKVVSVEFRKFESYAELRDHVEQRLGVRVGG